MDECNKLIEQLEKLEIEKRDKFKERKSKLKPFNFQSLHLEYTKFNIKELKNQKEYLENKRLILENEIRIETNENLNICYLELLEVKARQHMVDTYIFIKKSVDETTNRSSVLIKKVKRLKELYEFMSN